MDSQDLLFEHSLHGLTFDNDRHEIYILAGCEKQGKGHAHCEKYIMAWKFF